MIDFRVVCSKGFHVRTYASDIGNELGCGAHLESLRRTKSARFALHSVELSWRELARRKREG